MQKPLTPDKFFRYNRIVQISKPENNQRIILHFTAVDWHMVLFIKRIQAGEHIGGNTPFVFNITDYLGKIQNIIK